MGLWIWGAELCSTDPQWSHKNCLRIYMHKKSLFQEYKQIFNNSLASQEGSWWTQKKYWTLHMIIHGIYHIYPITLPSPHITILPCFNIFVVEKKFQDLWLIYYEVRRNPGNYFFHSARLYLVDVCGWQHIETWHKNYFNKLNKNKEKHFKWKVVASPFWVLASIGQCVSVHDAFMTHIPLNTLQDKDIIFGQNLQEVGSSSDCFLHQPSQSTAHCIWSFDDIWNALLITQINKLHVNKAIIIDSVCIVMVLYGDQLIQVHECKCNKDTDYTCDVLWINSLHISNTSSSSILPCIPLRLPSHCVHLDVHDDDNVKNYHEQQVLCSGWHRLQNTRGEQNSLQKVQILASHHPWDFFLWLWIATALCPISSTIYWHNFLDAAQLSVRLTCLTNVNCRLTSQPICGKAVT